MHKRPGWSLVPLLAGAALLLGASSGCGRRAAPTKTDAQAPGEESTDQKSNAAPKVAKLDPARLKQPFKDAVLLDPPIADGIGAAEFLPELTCTGKGVGKLFTAVAGKNNQGGLWDQVKLTDDQGRVIKYRAVLTTKLGEIHIDLYPQAAPNHVRNFIALARAGYFDGLPIYKSVRDREGETVVNAYIESGCPKGTGEIGFGSIGYWLKPETEGNDLKHEEGAVGATHGIEKETAACRFYIAAEKMPHMDGQFTVFGKVTRGLDLVRTINSAAVEDTTSYRLKEPVPIQSVAIQVVDEGT